MSDRMLEALAMAFHQTRPNNDAPEFDMDFARERAGRMALSLRSPRKDDLSGAIHTYSVGDADSLSLDEAGVERLAAALAEVEDHDPDVLGNNRDEWNLSAARAIIEALRR